MTAVKIIPDRDCAIYRAAELIEQEGPMSPIALFERVNFGAPSDRRQALERAYDITWLRETVAGWIDITENTKRYFEQLHRPAYVGQIAPTAYCGNVFGKPLDPKRIPSRHGLRPASDLAPTWSVRETVTIVTIGRTEP